MMECKILNNNEIEVFIPEILDESNILDFRLEFIRKTRCFRSARKTIVINFRYNKKMILRSVRTILEICKGTNYTVLEELDPETANLLSTNSVASNCLIITKPREIDLASNIPFSEGINGSVYKIDENSIVKIFKPGSNLESVTREFLKTMLSQREGLPTVVCKGLVKWKDRYGIELENINSDSLSKTIGKNWDKKSIYIKRYVNLMKYMHNINTYESNTLDKREEFKSYIDFISDKIDSEYADYIYRIFDEIPVSYTILHGDFHPGNIKILDNELVILDFDTRGYGHPLIEFIYLYSTFYVFRKISPVDVIHLGWYSEKDYYEIWSEIFREYFIDFDEEHLEILEMNLAVLSHARVLEYCYQFEETEENTRLIKEDLYKSIDKARKHYSFITR